MKPDRRAELRRLEDASFRTTASHDNEVLKERIKALESLLARSGDWIINSTDYNELDPDPLAIEIDAILPKTEKVKDA